MGGRVAPSCSVLRVCKEAVVNPAAGQVDGLTRGVW